MWPFSNEADQTGVHWLKHVEISPSLSAPSMPGGMSPTSAHTLNNQKVLGIGVRYRTKDRTSAGV